MKDIKAEHESYFRLSDLGLVYPFGHFQDDKPEAKIQEIKYKIHSGHLSSIQIVSQSMIMDYLSNAFSTTWNQYAIACTSINQWLKKNGQLSRLGFRLSWWTRTMTNLSHRWGQSGVVQ
jgi:hypothetical protein